MVVTFIRGLVTKGAKEDSPTRSIPALQNADIEWKILYPIPLHSP